MIAWESVVRLAQPLPIAFDQAILVAVLGLLVNFVSAAMLWSRHGHGHDVARSWHDHDHGHGHATITRTTPTTISAPPSCMWWRMP